MTDRPPVPEGWEFRLSHDRRLFAFYDPGNGPWFVPVPAMQGRFVDSAEMDRLDWYRYVPVSDSGRAEGLREAAALADKTAGEYRTPRLIAEMQGLAAELRLRASGVQPPTDRTAIQVQTLTEAAVALEAQTCDCGCRRGAEFLRQRAATLQAAGPRRLTSTPAVQRADRIVAHRLIPHTGLHCLRCAPSPLGDIWTPVTAEELDEGGTCTVCGTDVLIDPPTEG